MSIVPVSIPSPYNVFLYFLEGQVHKDSKLGMTNVGKSRLVKVIFSNIHKISDACANSFGRYIIRGPWSWLHNIWEMFLIFIKFKFLCKKGVSEKFKRKSFIAASHKPYNNCSSTTFLALFKKRLAPPPFKKEGRDYVFYMRDYKGETITLLAFYMTLYFISILPFYLQNCKVITFEQNLKIIWKMTYLISPYFWPKFTIIWISSHHHQTSSQDSPGTLRSMFANCFWGTIFCSKQNMNNPEYVWKSCLKESRILLKCRESFERLPAACNSSKNNGLPQFFLKVFWRLYFKYINFLTKAKRCLLCWLLWIQNY